MSEGRWNRGQVVVVTSPWPLNERERYFGTVTRVGEKFFYVRLDGSGKSLKVWVDTGSSDDGRNRVWRSDEEIEIWVQRQTLIERIKDALRTLNWDRVSAATLVSIWTAVSESDDRARFRAMIGAIGMGGEL